MQSNAYSVLIVDDETSVRESFVEFFEDGDWEVFSADSGEKALELLETINPPCALVDIRLPGINGDCFIRQASRLKPELKFIICTGSPEYTVTPDLLRTAKVFKEVFIKPVEDLNELEDSIKKYLAVDNQLQ